MELKAQGVFVGGIDALINRGAELVQPGKALSRAAGEPQRIVVVGPARGGTSLVAGALHHLGVFLGQKARPPVYEDVDLAAAIEGGDVKLARSLIKSYDDAHPIWAFKRPSLTDNLKLADSLFEHPKYIFIFKDILSIAKRNSISMGSDIAPAMERALLQYSRTLDFISDSRPACMLISYEKAVRYPNDFISSLVSFCELSPSEQQIRSAVAFIDPEPAVYLDSSRLNKSEGRLGGVRNGAVVGWARYLHKKVSAKVDIFVNDELVGSSIADRARRDLEQRFNRRCAFSFELPANLVLNPGDVLRARVSDDVFDLKNSPLVHGKPAR